MTLTQLNKKILEMLTGLRSEAVMADTSLLFGDKVEAMTHLFYQKCIRRYLASILKSLCEY